MIPFAPIATITALEDIELGAIAFLLGFVEGLLSSEQYFATAFAPRVTPA
jgi:hypothetical protein